MSRPRKPLIDPELKQQLGAAVAGGSPVQAVVRLRRSGAKAIAPAAAATERLAAKVVGRVAQRLGPVAGKFDLNVFPNLGYFVVSGSAELVEQITQQPEIASASANKRRG